MEDRARGERCLTLEQGEVTAGLKQRVSMIKSELLNGSVNVIVSNIIPYQHPVTKC
jgi:hypothetical protein